MAKTPAGWYPQEDGRQRYWDGEIWTEHFAPGAATAGGAAFAGAAAATTTARPWFKKKRFIIPAGLAGLAIMGSALGGGGDTPTTPAALDTDTSTSASATPTAAAAAASVAPSPVAIKPGAKPAAKPDTTPKFGSKVRDGKFEFVVSGVKCGIKTVGSEYFNTKAQGQFCRSFRARRARTRNTTRVTSAACAASPVRRCADE